MNSSGICVLGAGAWGTTLADLLSRNNGSATLWAREDEVVHAINEKGENTLFLPGIALHKGLKAESDCEAALKSADFVVFAIPSEHLDNFAESIAPLISPKALLISVTKGLDTISCRTMTQLICQRVSERSGTPISEVESRVLALSGPNLALEVARGIPSSTVIAGIDPEAAQRAQSLFMNDYLRVYTNNDISGVQLGGALKNIMAIAAGISDGLGFGANTKASLLTRGLAEMLRLADLFGARRDTFMGLSGLGDLMATAMSDLSRNRQFGVRIAGGEKPSEYLASSRSVVEGAKVVRQVVAMASRNAISVPICQAVESIIYGDLDPAAAVSQLMRRKPKEED
ncbi:MAG: glycerol-3-phosphate dehydrogenase [Candidatus Wallbacteria bacterium HGW-Wallbacteria-1]|jgi:glycerol-3-phosphate dehydrogenase (NAD(P)+)|uniref:Glycerol-3-phosphate dehydrogenase [NAD(P)+] n=1 Tax=Candidatus Wallbacteria bacterium HGW-Wallbacteria-1 TaxID=2013854 RepID=A0A2N1PTJ6_9BACT|nr:MAG: glycerol-3-phosphate dehydrogenase [Candidatus Wallbacteria bacterium HGW-Wallbacteria-1]